MTKKSLRLYCFSPPVMLATFAIEVGFALYVLWRYNMTKLSRLVVAILLCLALFQGTEFLLCGVYGIEPGVWSRVGYAAITLLPPLGIHLALTIARKKERRLLQLAYATAVMFVLYFAFYTPSLTGHVCYANYAVFAGKGVIPTLTYAVYYYGWLLLGMLLCWKYGRSTKQKSVRSALYALAIGYASFLVPTTIANTIDPSTIAGIPSIMCGFAVILAFVLVGRVLPEAAR